MTKEWLQSNWLMHLPSEPMLKCVEKIRTWWSQKTEGTPGDLLEEGQAELGGGEGSDRLEEAREFLRIDSATWESLAGCVASSGAGSLTAGAAVFACGEASRDRRFSRCKKNFYQWSWPDWLIQNMYKGEEKWWRNKWLKTSDLNLEFFQRTILGADYLGIMTQRKVSKIILFGGSSSWTILRFTPWTVWPPSQRSFWISPVS